MKVLTVFAGGTGAFSLLLQISVDGGVTFVTVDEQASAALANGDATYTETAQLRAYRLPKSQWQLLILNTSGGGIDYISDAQVSEDISLG